MSRLESQDPKSNVDPKVVEAFGQEWERFTNAGLARSELQSMFDDYATIFPWDELPSEPVGFDAGCGSGRWAAFFAPRVGHLYCIDASAEALNVARQVLRDHGNVSFLHEDLSSLGLEEESCDFGYSLGVLHHIPDTASALQSCVRRLRPGAPFLVYLYYDLEGAGVVRRVILRLVTVVRTVVSRLPRTFRHIVADVIAVSIYWPFARFARMAERLGRDPSSLPLFQYRNRSFSVMRNDALDRFGTRLEKRFSRDEVKKLLEHAGLINVEFSDGPPWWVAVGRRDVG
ncbi:MAG TPA: SAM-dependent methyltransferase [Acidimicrobiaceae bacterium]|nr:SAM-dependent methyltransferase [Acidimicrobiaceae bacterium]HAQ23773.1 SAM-dependent methyltransferase [Acidimicrobiaceae bacterium]HCV33158.1 SAM-dependent methyltransferase [Acidimicrobiaceae bacterium]